MQKFTYHCHTNFSDGRNTLEEMLDQAVKIGFDSIGISDHLIINDLVPTNRTFAQALPVLQNRIAEIRNTAKNYPLKVLVGFEIDYMPYPGWLDNFKKLKSQLDIDYLHTGNHYFLKDDCSKFISIYRSKEILSDTASLSKYFCRHFQTICQAVYSCQFDFLAHIDYARWSGLMKDSEYKDEIMNIVHALSETGTAVELNTKGLDSTGLFYPSVWILKELKAHKIPLVISDDAHHISQLGRYFKEAEDLLSDLGYSYRFSL